MEAERQGGSELFTAPPLAFLQEDNVLEIEPAAAGGQKATDASELSVAS